VRVAAPLPEPLRFAKCGQLRKTRIEKGWQKELMRKRTKRVLGGIAIAAGSLGALGALVIKKNKERKDGRETRKSAGDVWARPGMTVTFRAELMPGRDRSERTFRVKELLSSGRVLLKETGGEHTEGEFEEIR